MHTTAKVKGRAQKKDGMDGCNGTITADHFLIFYNRYGLNLWRSTFNLESEYDVLTDDDTFNYIPKADYLAQGIRSMDTPYT